MDLRLRLLALLPIAALTIGTTESIETWDGKPLERSPVEFQATMLAGHNAARAAVGAPPVAWDDDLARDATAYARKLAASGTFDHAAQEGQGENLWMGTRYAFPYRRMIGDWVNEQHLFVNRSFPDVSSTGDFEDVGHYTQVIWHNTDRLGCGIAMNGDDEYVVCRYRTPGNVYGERAI